MNAQESKKHEININQAEVSLCLIRGGNNILENVRMPFPWESVPRVCINCGHRRYEKNIKYTFFRRCTAIKCPKCGKKKFVKEPFIVF